MKKVDIIFVTICLLILATQNAYIMHQVKSKGIERQQQAEIDSLVNEINALEVMYLKCRGDIEVENLTGHYIDGKLKFYEIK